ncbi:hypothetical protein AA18889_2481 [Acetobacter senegalensis DSM 18889]|nr:hypothetical protein AA18889_2481 [Acetobacter senegalensis DSM 18889]
MTNPTNWPNPERPGVPMFPERGGWHILVDGGQCACYWHPGKSWWWNENKRVYMTLDDIAKQTCCVEYIGPVLTPAQIAEMLAAERERCAVECDKLASEFLPCHTSEYASAIRNLGDVP